MSIRTLEELAAMKRAGAIVRRVLEAMQERVRAGITTRELDEVGAQMMRVHGARSAPKLVYGFPGANCISLNEEAVHGVPSDRELCNGDVVKLDVTIEKDGFMADAAVTVPVGTVRRENQLLIDCAERTFHKAAHIARAGTPISEIGRVIESEVRRKGFSVIRELGGHGIGRTIHEEPSVPNFEDPEADELLTEGLVITIEPIISVGLGQAIVAKDGWTVRTVDHSVCAHYEHTLMIRRGTPLLLTAAT